MGYTPKTYRTNGGDKMVVASGGELEVQSGGTVDIQAGATLAGSLFPAITDPGDAGAVPVTGNGVCAITTAGAETRTVAIPGFIGQQITLALDTDGGDCVVTVASAVNQTGNNTLTGADAGDEITLRAITSGGTLAWRVASNDGWALATV
jgi:hypothetical protein